MTKDKRYTIVKNQIEGGYLKGFREIFDIIPKTVVAKDLKIHNIRFSNLINDVSRFELIDLYKLAGLLEIEEKLMLDLVHSQYLSDKRIKRKK